MWINSPLASKVKIDLKAVLEERQKEFERELERIASISYPSLCKFFNLSRDFTRKDLDKTYRNLLVKYYPDNAEGDIDKFDEVKKRYKELIKIIQNPKMEKFGITQR